MPATESTRHYKLFTLLIAVAALLPLLLIPDEMWDGDWVALSHMLQDFSRIALVKLEGWYINYWLRLGVHELHLWTGIPHKIFTNLMTIASILGIARESFKYLRDRFDISEKGAYWGAWAVLAFPVWHTLATSITAYYVLYLWLFMLAVNLYRKEKTAPALICFVISLQYFSLFAFAVGFACTEFIMTAGRENYRRKAAKTVVFSALLLLGFIVLQKSITMHGPSGTYNTFRLDQLNAFIPFGIMSLAFLAIWYLMHRYLRRIDSSRALRILLAFLCLSLFAVLPYWAVGRPLRFFAFGSFTARHTFLTCIPFALLVGVAYDCLSRYFKEKRIAYGLGFIVLALLVLLYQGYDHKVAALLFKDMLTHSFAAQEPPESGFVGIYTEGYKPPRHVHHYSINFCLYKAYGRAAWMANGFWRRQLVPTRSALEKLYPDQPTREQSLAFEVTGDAYTKYVFKLDNYHQEGRLWYWYCYVMKEYEYFKPTLTKKRDTHDVPQLQSRET